MPAAPNLNPSRNAVSGVIDVWPFTMRSIRVRGTPNFFAKAPELISRGPYRTEGRDAVGLSLDRCYVDLVPARTVEAWRAEQTSFIGLEDDIDWHKFEERQFVLSAELSGEERICYEHEYGIATSGVLKVNQRRALMPYVLQELSERRCWRRDGTSAPIWVVMDPCVYMGI